MPDTGQDLTQLAYQMYMSTDAGKAGQQAELKTKAAKARGPLLWVAISNTIFPLILMPMFSSGARTPSSAMYQLEIAMILVCFAYWGVWFWSAFAPLPAAIVGLLLFTSMSYAASASSNPDNGNAYSGIGLSGIITLVLLTKAIINGAQQRRLEIAERDLAAGQPAKLRGSIASGIWLYLALLSIVVIPRSLMAANQWEFSDIFKVQNFMAIVTITWAIIAWRDTLPAYRTIGEQKWYAFAILGALATSLLASVYLDVIKAALGVQPTQIETDYLNNGYGWGIVILSISIMPAIFEEMAFRGVIVPCLHRVLTEKETIAVTGIMFMVLHLSVYSAPHLLLLGCALAYVRLRSGSIYPCILMHGLHNAMCLGLDRVFG